MTTKMHPLVRQFANAMTVARPETPPTTLPAIGSFVRVEFGVRSQIAHVVGHTNTGRIKVRAWNKAQGKWMPNPRTLSPSQILGDAKGAATVLPPPPAL